MDVESESGLVVHLSREQAIVLFEFLTRYSNSDTLKIEDQAEARVLWDLCAELEKLLVEPFSDAYEALLERARESLRDDED